MTARKSVTRPDTSRYNCSKQVEDEVYRQMFRLEAHFPGAEIDLAIALLRAWIASGSASARSKKRQWLKKICPICLAMIEDAVQAPDTGRQCIQRE